MMQKGFLQQDVGLYGDEGSSECRLTEEQRKKIEELDFQHKANKKLNAMLNRGGDGDVAPWYNPEFPKGCQYNAPGCDMAALNTSAYTSDLHRTVLLENSPRWKEIKQATKLKEISLAYSSLKDADIDELFDAIKTNHNDELLSLDLSCNDIMDAGVQKLVSFLVGGCSPKLKELRLFQNKFGEIGSTILKQGLAVFRKDLVLVLDTPSFLKASANCFSFVSHNRIK